MDDKYDVEISDFDVDLGTLNEAEEHFLEAIPREQLRDSDAVILKATIVKENVVTLAPEPNNFLVTTSDTVNDVEDSSNQQNLQDSDRPKKSYRTIISMIAGSFVGNHDDVHEENMTQEDPTSHQNKLPTLSDAASLWGKELDEKQFIAFKVICCSFFLRFVIDGTEGDTEWSNLLSSGLECDSIDERNDLIQKLEDNGAMQQLIMFLTGPAGCGKSTCVELAQTYCHKFCQLAGLPFDDTTFYFTSTTGSSACLFGGTTIHSAAHLRKDRITDALCEEWKHVKILVIDEVSFLADTDMEELDVKLRKLTKKNTLYGGTSIIFFW